MAFGMGSISRDPYLTGSCTLVFFIGGYIDPCRVLNKERRGKVHRLDV